MSKLFCHTVTQPRSHHRLPSSSHVGFKEFSIFLIEQVALWNKMAAQITSLGFQGWSPNRGTATSSSMTSGTFINFPETLSD